MTEQTKRQRLIEDGCIRVPESGCWLWERCIDPAGYGRITYNQTRYTTHRFSYQAFVGPIEDGKCICHKCDVPSCCNPGHLYQGTPADNMRDKTIRNRNGSAFGGKSGKSKLTDNQVREIRKRYKLGQQKTSLAHDYNVTLSNIISIVNHSTWKHL